jgi:MoaA/NifB/PqqE/SkfB family radical SAM enzyme
VVARLARLPIRSIQVSIDGDTEETYGRQRPGGSLARAHAACRAIRAAGLPLEITFAPTRINLHEAAAVIARARELGAFRFNSGRLMRIGTAARHWAKVEADPGAWAQFRALLDREAARPGMELCYEPFTVGEALAAAADQPPATLLVLPNGWVKVSAALPEVCADLRQRKLREAWDDYRCAWREATMVSAVRAAAADDLRHGQANTWKLVPVTNAYEGGIR